MARQRTFTIALIVAAALLASGATLVWAAGIVDGHRTDHIGRFEPISRHLAPASAPVRPSTGLRATIAPPATTTTTTGDDNGRHNDD
jgi:hypothetical protein